ncbi:cysteine desulfurase family protein [Rhodococcus xishaensis]|uniref:Cysteine desulfurase n=1 Tax=Rhodococcus xishaensis TaxID=2487364 RepID=A0A438AZY5_9NOCA|nr:cysteine desulfurase family protein [Rhodococcus xishaensis]RVW04295.1 cysteine desulfurase [Rhodococcus xishaensis]
MPHPESNQRTPSAAPPDDRPVYLDYQATTPIDPRVIDAMLPYLTTHFGNPSSDHAYGAKAKAAIESARSQVAGLIGARPHEIVFTASGTESNHLALTGTAHTLRSSGCGHHIIISAIEHPATQATCDQLEHDGFEITRLPVRPDGLVDPDVFAEAARPDTVLASIMLANNEIGTIQPISAISRIAHERGVVMHTDAAQGPATIPVDVEALGVDLLTLVGHKMYAPKGVAALYIRDGCPAPQPQLVGGGQERGLRASTENVAGIVGLGAAANIARTAQPSDSARILSFRDRLLDRLTTAFPELIVNGSLTHRLPGNLSLTIPTVTASELMSRTPALAFSAGSACHTADPAPSPVLVAIGLDGDKAARTIRLGIGRYTTISDIANAADRMIAAAQR